MPDQPTPATRSDDPPTEATTAVVADQPVAPVTDEDGEDLGEVSGGGEVTDLGGDSPSS